VKDVLRTERPMWQRWILALATSVLVNEVLRLAAVAAFSVPPTFQPITRPAVIFSTAVGTTGGAMVFSLLRRYVSHPLETFRKVALTVLVVSWIPDVLLLLSPPPQLPQPPTAAVATLMVLHLPPWIASTWFLTGGLLPRRGKR